MQLVAGENKTVGKHFLSVMEVVWMEEFGEGFSQHRIKQISTDKVNVLEILW